MDATTKKHILIVEDSKDLQYLLGRLLRKAGYTISQAFNGQEALDLLHTVPEKPSFILLDIMMPVLDGPGFRNAQLKDPELAKIPVVVMTADNNAQACAKQLNVEHYFSKPFASIDKLLEVAQKLA